MLSNVFRTWNRKLHFYLGLYFLFFTWLFAFSGLLLNHSWKFAEFFPNRRITTSDVVIRGTVGATTDAAVARNVADQLGLSGEISLGARPPVPGRIDFNISRPGKFWQVQANPAEGHAHVVANQYNAWGVMRTLHSFTGVSVTNPKQRREWLATTVWALAMDALAVGLIIMVFGSYYMWWVLPKKRVPGLLALFAGCASCLVFVAGLRWLYS